MGRTVRAVYREAYAAMLSCQLLLAQGAWAVRGRRDGRGEPAVCSPRRAVLELRAAMPRPRTPYGERLAGCARERRPRTTPKEKRPWPRRTPHKPPRPPKLRTMGDDEKALYSRLNAVS